MMADALLKQDDIALIEEKNYIRHPKQNGYRSLHLIVAVPIFLQREKRIMRVEIQLRTVAMDSWASLEHQLRYKKDTDFDDQMLAELRCCADLSAQLDARMDRLRVRVSARQPDERELVRESLSALRDNPRPERGSEEGKDKDNERKAERAERQGGA